MKKFVFMGLGLCGFLLFLYGIRLAMEKPSLKEIADIENKEEPNAPKSISKTRAVVSTKRSHKLPSTPYESKAEDENETEESESLAATKPEVAKRPPNNTRLENDTFVALRAELKPLLFSCLKNDKMSDDLGVKNAQLSFKMSWTDNEGTISSENHEESGLEQSTIDCIEAQIGLPKTLSMEHPNLDKYPFSYSFAWE